MNLRFFRLIFFAFLLLLLNSCGVRKSLQDRPDLSGIENIDTARIKIGEDHYVLGKNSLFKNKYGIWELYVEGDPLERGLAAGSLTRDLIHKQEDAFMGKIGELVPSKNYRHFLQKMIYWFNRKMYLYVPEEYKQEIYGVSRFASKKYNDFAPAYLRLLYFHGAHDIGHALQDLMLVGCTSFAAWDEKTTDGELLLGRNFDFYAGDEFAKEKIAEFVNPDHGHKFMMYTWGGMIGAVSGMNAEGLTVTLNAGKSKIPLVAKTPISLVAREILQYASTTSEAIEIAKKRDVFVSEAIMVGSASERKAILIEVSPKNFGVYEVPNSNELICSNHFQSKAYQDDRRNEEAIENSHSEYRYERMQQLLNRGEALDPERAAEILRNRRGIDGKRIGYGNEKAIDQLLAHHGIIFKPEENKVWVSANPYQLGAFVAYDLDEVFARFAKADVKGSVATASEVIPEDDFIHSEDFRNYEKYRKLSAVVNSHLEQDKAVSEADVEELKQLNPYFWKPYALAGEYYFRKKNYKKAVINFKQARKREVTTRPDKEYLDKMIRKSYSRM